MRVARTVATLLAAIAMALMMVLQAIPASAAVAGYGSKYVAESDFVSIQPGETKQFVVIFRNTGTLGWQKNSSSQVDLAQCCPYNSPSPNSGWNPGTWQSVQSYTTHSADFVGPGSDATFAYSIKAPASAAAGTYRFAGDLAKNDTREMINPEGYYQEATVPAGGTQPTMLDLQPTFQSRVVGTTATVTAEVTGEPPTGSTTRRPITNTQVTFILDACPHAVDDGGCGVGNSLVDNNPDVILTATTDSAGKATANFTRVNPGNDRVDAYVSGVPAVRDQSTVNWGIAAAITVTPDDATSLANNKCRDYTVTQKNPSTGAATTNQLWGNFTENIGSTTDNDGGATIGNGSGVIGASPTNLAGVALTTGSTQTVAVCGNSVSSKTVTLIAFDNNSGGVGTALESGDRSDTGGAVTFTAPLPVFTLTPDATSSQATGAQVVYSITAVDQFGTAWTTALGASIGFVEATDNLASTSTTAQISWQDSDGTNNTTPAAGCATIPAGTVPPVFPPQQSVMTLDATGKGTFAVCASAATTGTPVVWYDANANGLREADERQDVGGAVTWATAAVTSAKMSPSSATNATSTTGDSINNGSIGEEIYTFSFVDQSGNPIAPPAATTVTFTVSNTGSNTIYIVACNGVSQSTAILAGASNNTACTPSMTTSGGVSVEVDAPQFTSGTGSATISASATSGSTFAASGTKSWITASAEPTTACNTVAGTVIATDKGASSSDGTGAYIVQTQVAGNFYIDFVPTDTFRVQGTTTAAGTFETSLSVGDTVTFTAGNCSQTTGVATDVHDITNNQP